MRDHLLCLEFSLGETDASQGIFNMVDMGGGAVALSMLHLVIFGLIIFISSLPCSVQCFCLPYNAPSSSSYHSSSTDLFTSPIHPRPRGKFCVRITFKCPSFIHLRLYLKAFDIFCIPVDLRFFKLCIPLSKEALNSTLEGYRLKHFLLWSPKHTFPCCHFWWL